MASGIALYLHLATNETKSYKINTKQFPAVNVKALPDQASRDVGA